jgi:hypothetical protein
MWYGPITFVPLTQDIAPLVVGWSSFPKGVSEIERYLGDFEDL